MARKRKAAPVAEQPTEVVVEQIVEEQPPVVEDQPVVEELTTEQVTEIRTELAKLQARVAELKGILASLQVHVLITSTVGKPVAMVREIFLAMVGQRRRDVINKCVTAGIATNTAKTQYQILKGKLDRGELAEELAALAGEFDTVGTFDPTGPTGSEAAF